MTAVTAPSLLVALDIDGTLMDSERRIPAGTVETLDLVRAAGHEVVLATGRSLAGLLPIATRLGLTTGWAVCSNPGARHGPFRTATGSGNAPIPSGVGTTMRAIEAAALEAGLPYPRGDEGRRRAQWRSVTGHGPAGFELPLSGP